MILSEPVEESLSASTHWVFKSQTAMGFQKRWEIIKLLFQKLPSQLAGFDHFEYMSPSGASIILQSGGGISMFVADYQDYTSFTFSPLLMHPGTRLTAQATLEDANASAQKAYELLSTVEI